MELGFARFRSTDYALYANAQRIAVSSFAHFCPQLRSLSQVWLSSLVLGVRTALFTPMLNALPSRASHTSALNFAQQVRRTKLRSFWVVQLRTSPPRHPCRTCAPHPFALILLTGRVASQFASFTKSSFAQARHVIRAVQVLSILSPSFCSLDASRHNSLHSGKKNGAKPQTVWN